MKTGGLHGERLRGTGRRNAHCRGLAADSSRAIVLGAAPAGTYGTAGGLQRFARTPGAAGAAVKVGIAVLPDGEVPLGGRRERRVAVEFHGAGGEAQFYEDGTGSVDGRVRIAGARQSVLRVLRLVGVGTLIPGPPPLSRP